MGCSMIKIYNNKVLFYGESFRWHALMYFKRSNKIKGMSTVSDLLYMLDNY